VHVSEGILSAQVLAAGTLMAAGGVALGLKKMKYERMPEVAVVTSAFFVASLIRVPVGPANLHLTLNGLMGLLLGWMSFPAVLVALVLQGLLFQFGGLTALGVNTLIMATPAVAVYYLFGRLSRQGGYSLNLFSGFCAGAGAIFLGTVLLSLALYKTQVGFLPMIKVIVVAQLPAMIVEGAITAFIMSFLFKVKPEVLAESG
jgi:cobalt/nickel transport system permease protein